MNSRTLFFGPYPNPITGQSISFKEVYDSFLDKKLLVNTTKYESNKVLNNIYSIIKSTYYLIFKRINVVYFTCSRNKTSAVKDLWLILLASFFKIKIINHLHGKDFKHHLNSYKYYRKQVFSIYKKINISIVLLPSMKEEFSQFKNMNIEVVENCYSSEYSNLEVDLSRKKNQILYLSNLIYSKGILVFLDALKDILTNTETKVYIAGKPMADDYMSDEEIKNAFFTKLKILEKDFPERVFYVGLAKGNEKLKLLEESSIFILPTFYKTEALPISIIEAMRFGNAVVTTNHNYLADVISSKNGRLVNTNDETCLKNAIIELLQNKEKLKENQFHNIKEAKSTYDPAVFNNKIYKILNNL